jgi:translation initiation factor IF-2
MAKKRVHEIAKEQGLTSKELIAKLQAAGIEVKAAASSVEEAEALKALGGNGAAPKAQAPAEPEAAASPGDGQPPAADAPPADAPEGGPQPAKQRPTRDSLAGERAPGSGGGRRRVVIDSQASRRQDGRGGPPPSQKPRRGRRRGRRRREVEAEVTGDRAAPAARALDVIRINSGSTVKETAESLGVPVPEVIKTFMSLGEMATLTQTLSNEAIQVLAEEFSKEIEIVHAADDVEAEPEFEDADEDLVDRPPVVTIMGHVDHGKTSLLDAIRETEVVAGEAGGITQHIGAYQVHHGDKKITFLDTPGHEAFTAMRARGAGVTDIAVIVVAADDGVKPQTDEAIDHAKAADVPILVAVNKIDKEGAQPDRVRADMAQRGLNPAEWGGDTEFVDVSAKTKQGLDDLLETITVVAELEELQANPDTEASGTVIESKLDPGRGPVVTILVQRGTLQVGDPIVAGAHWGKVRAMHDYVGERVKQAEPGEPVEILGFDGVPEAGEHVHVVENDRRARQLAGERAQRLKTESIARRSGMKVSLEDVFKRAQQGQVQELALVLKADVAGSLEALEDEIAKLPQREVAVTIVHRGVGGINESDVMLAAASEGVVLGFNVRPVGDARAAAEREGVEIRTYTVIYRVIEDLPRRHGGHARARRGRGDPGRGRDQAALQGIAGRHDRRLGRHRGQGHAGRQGAPRARRNRRLRRRDRLPAALPGRRQGSHGGPGVRDRAQGLPGRQGRRHPRGLCHAQGRARARIGAAWSRPASSPSCRSTCTSRTPEA